MGSFFLLRRTVTCNEGRLELLPDIPLVNDYNDGDPHVRDGLSQAQYHVFGHNDSRQSAYDMLLRPVLGKRSNLEVRTLLQSLCIFVRTST